MGLGRLFARGVMLPACRQLPLLREASAYVDGQLGPSGYETLRKRFIENGEADGTTDARRELAEKFAQIHDSIEMHSTPNDSLAIAEAALSASAGGDLVECGCFKGGSTATLSIIAASLGKRLLVFDSFEGLPPVNQNEQVDYQGRDSRSCTWKNGANHGSFEEVVENVRRFGDIDVCTFTKGWFVDTLRPPNLPESICLAFTDVVLASSVRQCLVTLWPRLSAGAIYFSRDVALTKALQALYEPQLWRELDALPPILFGGGYGLKDGSPHLGFMVKGADILAEYLDSLRIYKPLRADQTSSGVRRPAK